MVDVYLYTGRWGKVRRRHLCVGKFDAKRIVSPRTRLTPPSAAFVSASFFGGHAMAQELVRCDHPCFRLIKVPASSKQSASRKRGILSGQLWTAAMRCASTRIQRWTTSPLKSFSL